MAMAMAMAMARYMARDLGMAIAMAKAMAMYMAMARDTERVLYILSIMRLFLFFLYRELEGSG